MSKQCSRLCWCLLLLLSVFVLTEKAVEGAPLVEHSHFDIICRNLLNLNCSMFQENNINCGTDGVTYNNSCQFAQSHCREATLHVQHAGRCVISVSAGAGAGAVGNNPPHAAEGMAVVLQLVCDDVVHVDCAGQPRVMLCASDGRTYYNNCFYEKARCHHYELRVLHAGRC